MSVNKVILIGNLCHDPSIKYFDNGGSVAQFSIATNERAYTLKNGTEVPQKTEFHNVVIRGKLSEVAEKYLSKGDKIYIEGKLRTRSYDDAKGGAKRYITEIVVDNMEMLSTKQKERQSEPEPEPERGGDYYKQDDQEDLPF